MAGLFAKTTAPTLNLKADAQGELRQQKEKVARILKSGQIVHIAGAGHNVRRDEKQRTLAALRPFLAKFAEAGAGAGSQRVRPARSLHRECAPLPLPPAGLSRFLP